MEKKLNHFFATHSKCTEVHATSNGLLFIQKHHAEAHAWELKDRTIKTYKKDDYTGEDSKPNEPIRGVTEDDVMKGLKLKADEEAKAKADAEEKELEELLKKEEEEKAKANEEALAAENNLKSGVVENAPEDETAKAKKDTAKNSNK